MGVENEGAHWLGSHEGTDTEKGAVRLSLPAGDEERKKTIRTIAKAIESDTVPVVDVPVGHAIHTTQLERLPIAIGSGSVPSSSEVGDYTPLGSIDIIHPDDGGLYGLLGIHHNPILGFVGFLHNTDGEVLFTDDHQMGEEAAYVLAVMTGIEAAREALRQNIAYGIIQARQHKMNHAMGVLMNAMRAGIEPHHKIISMLEHGELSDRTVNDWSREIIRWERQKDQQNAIVATNERSHHEDEQKMPEGFESDFQFKDGFFQPGEQWKRTIVIPIGANQNYSSWEEENSTRGGSHGRGTTIIVHEEYSVGGEGIYIDAKHKFRRK